MAGGTGIIGADVLAEPKVGMGLLSVGVGFGAVLAVGDPSVGAVGNAAGAGIAVDAAAVTDDAAVEGCAAGAAIMLKLKQVLIKKSRIFFMVIFWLGV
jgi:hypothetical protein